MQVLRFHECPECGRLSPYLQSRCDCGYRFVGSEAQYKTCPECGSIIPSGQIVCDCGHVTLPKVRKSAPSSPVTGDVWYGPEYLFGEDTRRYQCEGTFRFYDDGEYYQGWTLELYLQDNGNMDSDPIDASDWPA